jgi:hypothetical protein
MSQETLLDNYGCRNFQTKQSFQSCGQLKEFIDGRVQKKTIFLSTLFAMSKYSTYTCPTISLHQVVTKKSNIV